jgi:hypothetical protein
VESELPTYTSLSQLVDLIEEGEPVFVRWSRGPETDRSGSAGSKDELTGTPMPGLSANPLRPEPWWGDQPTLLWVARRLYDYSHLREDKGPDIHPWVLVGEEAARGPDNEPLVHDIRPVAWIARSVIDEAEAEVARQRGAWGPMRRPARFAPHDTDGERPQEG